MPDETSPAATNDGKKVNFKRAGREMSMQYLYQFDLAGAEFNQKELDLFWKKVELGSDPDLIDKTYFKSRKYAERLIHGVVENLVEIDKTLTHYSQKWELSRMGAIDRNILRTAVFEMLFCEDIPPIVSINEAVEISKDFASDRSSAFINGVLNGVKNNLDRPVRGEKK